MLEKESKTGNFEEEKKRDLLSQGEISLIIDTYDDIFSDFDPRPFTHRALSDDFLLEAKRATLEKEGIFELRFSLPRQKRNWEHEVLIKKRLREHFKKHVLLLEEEIKKVKKRGIIMAIAGVIMLFTASMIARYNQFDFFYSFLLVLLEPGGWFLAWTGLEQLFYNSNEKRPDLLFYQKMSKSAITFISY